jgi:hypothetical protein
VIVLKIMHIALQVPAERHIAAFLMAYLKACRPRTLGLLALLDPEDVL